MPSAAMRVAFFWAEARPFFLRMVIASSISPFASTRAFLQSIIPAPVFSRRSFTFDALISMNSSLFKQKNSHGLRGLPGFKSVESVKSVAFLLHHCGFVGRLYRFIFAFHPLRACTLERRHHIAH